MRIAFIAAANNLHTLRWANALSERGHDLHLLSAHPASTQLDPGVTVHHLRIPPTLGYLVNAPSARRVLSRLRPQVVNAHYASGYGTLARLAGASPLVLSVWGSDVFDFPRISGWRARLVRKNLAHADVVCSISHVMAKQCQRVCPEASAIRVVPWGVDTSVFDAPAANRTGNEPITIGTVKTLNPKYGIDTLIGGFESCRRQLSETDPALANRLRLRIVGDGAQRKELVALAKRLAVDDVTEFVGAVPHDRVVDELKKLHIYVAASRLDSESFGVAIVEALACRRPVVVSDAGGLPEVVRADETGIVTPRENPTALGAALTRLTLDPTLGNLLAAAGREDVRTRFEWSENVTQMEAVLEEVAHRSRSQTLKRVAA